MDVVLIGEMAAVVTAIGGNIIMAEKNRSRLVDLDKKTEDVIKTDGIYHFTTRESAIKIMESGFLMPTLGKGNNHRAKSRDGKSYGNFVYMFAGKPNLLAFAGNLAHRLGEKSDGTFYAIRHRPDDIEIKNYQQRVSDGALTYEGKLDLENSHPEIVRMKFDLSKGGLVEIPFDEEVKKTPFVKRVISNSLTKTIGLGAACFFAGKDLVSSMALGLSPKIHRLLEQRRITNDLLEQLNSENLRINFSMIENDKKYLISQGDDKIIDGRLLSEVDLVDLKDQKTRKVYFDSTDFSNIPGDKLQAYFKKVIDFDTDYDQYAGKPVFRNGEVVESLDEDFFNHFNAKQVTSRLTNPIYESLMKNKSKKQLGFFKKMYELTDALARQHAIKRIAKYRTKENTKEAENYQQEDYRGDI